MTSATEHRSDNSQSKIKVEKKTLLVLVIASLILVVLLPSMLWLLFVMFSLGYALTREKSLNAFGYGLAAFTVISMALNLVGIPLHWMVFLGISLLALYYVFKREGISLELPDLSIKNNWHLYLVILFFALNFYVYFYGATRYPYLEDTDPWNHALGTLFVRERMSFSTYFDREVFVRLYIEPYPPAYNVLMGVLAQFHDSISFVLKFYNAFFVAVTLIIAYYFFAKITNSKDIALIAVFCLLVMPAFMSHFIWAQTIAMIFFILSLYSVWRVSEEKNFILPTGIVIAALGVSQPSTAIVFIPFVLLLLCSIVIEKGFKTVRYPLMAGMLGLLIVMVLYWLPTFVKFGVERTLEGVGLTSGLLTDKTEDTSGGVVYTLDDFIFAREVGKIDQQIGIGILMTAFALLGLSCAIASMKEGRRDAWLVFALAALVFSIIGVQGNALPVKLFPHRFWVFLAIPVAMLASYGIYYLIVVLRRTRIFRKKLMTIFLIGSIVLGMIVTSGIQKYRVQTAYWPTHGFASNEEIAGYSELPNLLPRNTKVFTLCNTDGVIAGMDMMTDFVRDREYFLFKQSAYTKNPEEVRKFLKSRMYDYLIFDSSCIVAYKNSSNANMKLQQYLNSEGYSLVFSNEGFFLFRIN